MLPSGSALEGNATSAATTNESGQYSFDNLSPGKYELRADPFSGWNLTAPGAGRYEVTLSDKSGSGLDWGFFAHQAMLPASLPVRKYPIMRPTQEEASLWAGQYNASARAYLSPEIANKMASAPVTSFSLLDRLKYTPSERDQGTCGNCWAWAGTGVMELDYARQKGVSDRLSVQYLDSNYNGGCGNSGACCGGWLPDLVGFYQAKGIMVPWSNSNAHYRDGRQDCGACSLVSASSISTNPHYDLSAISVNTIPTQKMTKEEAISNIKNVLLQGKGIWFAYYLPDKSAWDNFFSFWGNEPESAVWQPDGACGKSFDYKTGGGHAVLCVGYDETDPNNRYWIMLNSWGSTAGRPAGIFRMKMDMNYDCSYGDIGYAFYWMTLDMSYPGEENHAPQTPSLPVGAVQGSVLDSLSYTARANDPEGDPVRFTFNWGDGTTSETESISSGQAAASHAWKKAGTYQITAKATDDKEASSEWSEALAVAIAGANSEPSKPAKPQGSRTGISQKSYSYTASAIDPDGDDLQITFDWGDASTSQTEMVKSGTLVQMPHSWSQAGTYQVRVMAKDGNDAESLWSASKAVKIYAAPARTKDQAAARPKRKKQDRAREPVPVLRSHETAKYFAVLPLRRQASVLSQIRDHCLCPSSHLRWIQRNARHARLYGGASYGCGHGRNYPSVQGRGNDAHLGYALNQSGNGLRSCDLHGLIDVRCPHIQGPAKDPRKAQHIVDLIGEIGSTGGHHSRSSLQGQVGHDLGHGIGHGKDYGISRHALYHGRSHNACHRQAQEDVRTPYCIGQTARNIAGIGHAGDLLLGRVEVGPALVDHTPAIAEYGILYPEAVEKFGDGDAGGASSAHGDLHLVEGLANYLEGIDESRQGDHGGAMLIIVKYGYRQDLLETLLYLKAARRTYVLQVDSAKDALYSGNCLHDDRWVLAAYRYGKGIYAREVLEQNGFSFHDRYGCQRPNISQAQDGSSVCYHGYDIALGGVLVNVVWILFDLATGFGHARSIS